MTCKAKRQKGKAANEERARAGEFSLAPCSARPVLRLLRVVPRAAEVKTPRGAWRYPEKRTGGDRRATQEKTRREEPPRSGGVPKRRSAPEGRTTKERYHVAMAAETARRRRLKRAVIALALGVATTLAVVGVLANINKDIVSGKRFIVNEVWAQLIGDSTYAWSGVHQDGWGETTRSIFVATDMIPARKAGHVRPRIVHGLDNMPKLDEGDGIPVVPGVPRSHALLQGTSDAVEEIDLGVPMRCMWTRNCFLESSNDYGAHKWIPSGVLRPHNRAAPFGGGGFGREYGFPTGVLPVGFAVNTAVYGAAWYLLLAIPSARRKRRERRGLCAACRYNRAGLAADTACPECGAKTVAG
jgi:hypothetical protein